MAAEQFALPDSEATEALGASLGRRLIPGSLILLEGPLGAGKTTLVRGMVAGLGGDSADVASPSFTLLATYEVSAPGISRVHHADLYRLRGLAQAPWEEIGLPDCLADPEGVTAVEWPEEWPWLEEGATLVVRIVLHYAGEGRCARVAWETARPIA